LTLRNKLHGWRNNLICFAPMAKQDAAYYRDYRATRAQLAANKDQELVRAGIARCIEYMRSKVGTRALTGNQAALMIERAMLSAERHEITARRNLLQGLRG
jgi:hypothetical protein